MIIVVVIVTVVAAVVTMKAVAVPIVIMIPMMIMFYMSAVAIPVAGEEAFAVVMRRHPAGPGIGWQSPVAFVPPVMSSHRVPVTVDPNIIRTRCPRDYSQHARRWRSADRDSNRNLGVRRPRHTGQNGQ